MAWRPDYIEPDDLKDYLGITDANDDAVIALAVTSASRAIDAHCSGSVKRQFGKVDGTQTRTYRRPWYDSDDWSWVIEIDDLYDLTGIAVTVDGVDVTADVVPGPDNALLDGMVYERLTVPRAHKRSVITVATDKWGWPLIPPPVTEAGLLQSNRFFKRLKAPFGIAGSPDQGSEIRLLARVDPDVAVALGDYRRPGATG